MLHKGYEVWIADHRGQRLPEYNIQIEGDDGKTITCYIPSESGGTFCIRWKDHNGPGSNHTSMRTFVDGISAGKTHCAPGVAGKRKGVRTDQEDAYRLFQFADLQTTDDDDVLWRGGVSEMLGTIELRVVHVHPHIRKAAFRPYAFTGVGAVHERSKKAGAHCVTLGRTEKCKEGERRDRIVTTLLDKRAGPFVTFVFRYRPPAILQAQGIIDPTASRSPRVKRERKSAPSRRDKSKQPVKREATDAGPSLKPDDVIELSDDEDQFERKPVVKREASRRPAPRFDPDDVIDLTLD